MHQEINVIKGDIADLKSSAEGPKEEQNRFDVHPDRALVKCQMSVDHDQKSRREMKVNLM